MYRSRTDSFSRQFLDAQIITYSVSTCAFISGWILKPIHSPHFSIIRFLTVIAGIFVSATLGVFIGIGFIRLLFSEDLTSRGIGAIGIVLPSLLITAIFIAFFTMLGRVKEKQRYLENDFLKITNKKQRDTDTYISVKNGDMHKRIEYKNLIYISSSGRISVVHTRDKDYEVRELLGDLEKQLPDTVFLRIHKQFVVNTDYISGLRYYEGGRYNMHLTDDDETVLPVGKSFTKDVKSRMKI